MSLDSKKYTDGQTLLQKMIKLGKDHDPKGEMVELDEDDFPTDEELANTSTDGNDWRKEIYKLIYHQLDTGAWLSTLLNVQRNKLPIVFLFVRLDAFYLRCSSDTMQAAREALHSASFDAHSSQLHESMVMKN